MEERKSKGAAKGKGKIEPLKIFDSREYKVERILGGGSIDPDLLFISFTRRRYSHNRREKE